jgi:hypothetical protein
VPESGLNRTMCNAIPDALFDAAFKILGAHYCAETAWLPFSIVGEVRHFAGETGGTGVTTRRIAQLRGDRQG